MPVRRLSEGVINRIAAGEVVERPASVVKELVENSIDAAASRIDIVIEGGGKALIGVVDDGTGMARHDLELALERHATSKLAEEDLVAIRTLGFRGEALPSIAAVARLVIASRHRDEEHGWEVAVRAGRKSTPRPAALAAGTRVEVSDLFFSTPARLKFLKSDRAESGAIADVVKRLAMAHPAIHFTLSGAGRSPIEYPAATGEGARLHRLAQVMGSEFGENAVPVIAERGAVRLTGFAGLPTFNRANSLSQFLFVNGRSVRDKLFIGAVRGAYADVLARDRFPVVALFLDCDPHLVDVNVHPAKTEVRFADPGLVRGLIVGALKEALAAAGHRVAANGAGAMLAALHRPAGPARAPQGPLPGSAVRAVAGFAEAQAVFAEAGEPSAEIHAATPSEETAQARPLGVARAQIHGTYIIAQTGDGIVIVDQHAAHERIVMERLKRALLGSRVAGQKLLIPDIVEMPQEDVDRIIARAGELDAFGLVVERFGPGAVMVRETPALLGEIDTASLLRDIADDLAEWDSASRMAERIDRVIATMACHRSIRAGRILKADEMNALLREMEATPLSGQCNHGRPTHVELKLADIERLFGRK